MNEHTNCLGGVTRRRPLGQKKATEGFPGGGRVRVLLSRFFAEEFLGGAPRVCVRLSREKVQTNDNDNASSPSYLQTALANKCTNCFGQN